MGCKMLEGVVFPESMETIRQRAFNSCFGIGSIVCRGTMPPRIESGAFDGVAKDNFTVEVPSSAVAHYQTAQGWCDFKRIAAHHELTCSPSVACALSTEHKQTVTVNAEGEWEVASKPDWCEVSPMSGNKKTNVTITIKATAKSSGSDRNGKVVFRLKDKDYTHECSVSQYGYQYGEDEWVTLQKATRGNRGGINIVLLGDGYDANEIASGEYLKVMNQEKEWTKFPVLHFDMSELKNCTNIQSMRNILSDMIARYEEQFGAVKMIEEEGARFRRLLEHIYSSTGKQVVVLIDEYDAPMMRYLYDEKMRESVRSLLRGFYQIIKSGAAYLRFVFITGVTKFSQLSIFS